MEINFLTASWQNLLAVNWEVNPDLLKKYLPRGTSLDLFEGRAYVSLVAFNFSNNKFLGIIPTVPYSFPEVNLRFYIKRETEEGTRKAVAFIKEIVPSGFIALCARIFYNEKYEKLKLSYSSQSSRHCWKIEHSVLHSEITCLQDSPFRELKEDKLANFIFEHYFGYSSQPDASTLEYQVKHRAWQFSQVHDFKISPQIVNFFDPSFTELLLSQPVSVYLANGSDVSVSFPRRFKHPLSEAEPRGWILYDASCGFCSWWITLWQKTVIKAGYSSAALQDEWVKEKIDLTEQDLNKDIRLLLSDGTLISALEAYLYLMKEICWLRPFSFIFSLPIIKQFASLCYRIINRNRFFISRTCGLNPKKDSGSGE